MNIKKLINVIFCKHCELKQINASLWLDLKYSIIIPPVHIQAAVEKKKNARKNKELVPKRHKYWKMIIVRTHVFKLPGNLIYKLKFSYSSYENYANFCFSQEYFSKATGARNTSRDNYGILMQSWKNSQ